MDKRTIIRLWRWPLLLAGFFVFTQPVDARMGETPQECLQRYGSPVANYRGYGSVASIAIYTKDGIHVTVFFVNSKTDVQARAGFVMYSRNQPNAKWLSMLNPYPPYLTADEESTLLATVPGNWTGYDPPKRIAAPEKGIKEMALPPTATEKSHEAAKGCIVQFVSVFYPSFQKSQYAKPEDLGHIGSEFFAFRVIRGVAICSSESMAPLSEWVDHLMSERQKNQAKPAERKLSGF